MSVEPTLYGAAYSVYVRAARLTLQEKGVAYRLVPVDVFSEEGVPADHLERHPFGRIPHSSIAGSAYMRRAPSRDTWMKRSPALRCNRDRPKIERGSIR